MTGEYKSIEPNADNDLMFRQHLMTGEKKHYGEIIRNPDDGSFTEGGVQKEKIEYFTD